MKKKKQPTIVDVLRRMRVLLRKGWTQGVDARGKSGREVGVDSPYAVSFCLIGARDRAVLDLGCDDSGYIESRWYLQQCTRGFGAETYNDNDMRTKAQILKTVDCAIALASKEDK